MIFIILKENQWSAEEHPTGNFIEISKEPKFMLIEQSCTPKAIASKCSLLTEFCCGIVFVFKSLQYNSNDVCSPE